MPAHAFGMHAPPWHAPPWIPPQSQDHVLSDQVRSLSDDLKAEKKLRLSLEKEVTELKKQVYKRQKTQSEVRGVYNKKEVNEQFKKDIAQSVETVTGQYSKMGRSRMGKLLAEAFWTLLLGSMAQSHLIRLASMWLRENVFTPWKVLRAMDLAGGLLSFSGLEILRALEHQNRRYWRYCILPSRGTLQAVAYQVQTYGMYKIPFRHVMKDNTGEGIEFDNTKALLTIFEACGLTEVAKQRPVMIAGSVDGSDLSKHVGFIMGGICVNDKATLNPMTKLPIYADNPDGVYTVQSRNLDFPLGIYMGRETNKTFAYFNPMFSWLNECGDIETTHLPPEYQPLNVCINCDLSAAWKGLMKGGAAKIKFLPCHCCDTTSDELQKPNYKNVRGGVVDCTQRQEKAGSASTKTCCRKPRQKS